MADFSGVVNWRFCWGFLKKVAAERGVFVVKLWWNAWQTWSIDGRF
jgi:hypothetical protein